MNMATRFFGSLTLLIFTSLSQLFLAASAKAQSHELDNAMHLLRTGDKPEWGEFNGLHFLNACRNRCHRCGMG